MAEPMKLFVLVLLAAQLVAAVSATSSTVRLNDGTFMPRVAAGSWQYESAEIPAAIANALATGYRHLDTAHDYCADGSTGDCRSKGKSVQQAIGVALQKSGLPRDELYITTKVPGCGLQGIGFDTCAEDSVAAAKGNLNELNATYTDLLLVHFPPDGGCGPSNCAAMQKQWTALTEQVLAKNLTRTLGVSNFCVSCLECLMSMPHAVTPAVNQVEYHVGMGPDPEGLLSYSAGKGIVVEAYSPLGTGSPELLNGSLTTSIGQAHNKSSPSTALRWILEHIPALTVKAANPAYLTEDLAILGWSLTEAEVKQLDAATSPAGTPSFKCTS